MALSVIDFWKLTIDASLFQPDDVAKLAEEFHRAVPGAGDAQPLAQWLITTGKISPYQSKILLAGRAGPFVYGDYRIYDRIESGRLAGIFRAIHIETRHPVCLYFLSGAAMKDPQVLARLKQQTAQTYRVTVGHPNLLKCYHLAEEGPYKFIVIDDLQGKRVERLLAVNGALSVAESCRIIRQAALGLARLHAMGQFHGDIRPANIWIAKRHVKLLLFPVYRDPLKPYAPLSEADPKGKIPPEADYIAPELIGAQRMPDPRSDIYSLGCTLYHMLANQAPFAGGDLEQKLHRHATEKPRPLDQLNLGIPTPLAKVVNYMMAKDPDMRYQQANSVVEALLPHLSPEDAQSKPEKPTRHGRAYEAWLHAKLGAAAVAAPGMATVTAAAAAAATVAAAAPAELPPAPPPERAAPSEAEPTQLGPTPEFAPAAPLAAAPVALAPAAPVVAAPVMAAPAVAAPVQPVPASPYAPVPLAPAMPAPVMAAPLVGGPALFPNAPLFPNAAPAFPNAAPQFPSAGPTFPSAAPQFPNVGPSFPNAPLFPNAPPEPSPAPAASGGPAPVPPMGEEAIGAVRPRRRRKSPLVPALVVGAVLLLVGGGAYVAMTMQSVPVVSQPPEKKSEPQPQPAVASTGTPAPAAAPPPPAPAEPPASTIWALDDGMWASPTKGQPLDLKWLAPGAQAVIALRPADLMKHEEAERLLDAKVTSWLGEWVQTGLPKLAGTRLDNIESVLVALLDGAGGPPRPAFVIRLAEAVPESELLAAWGNPATEQAGETKFFQASNTGYFLPASGEGRLLVIAPLEEMREMMATGGEPALRLEMEVLLKSSDQQRHFTFVIAPSFLLTGGKSLLSGPTARLRDGIDWLLMGVDAAAEGTPPADTEPPKAVLFSAHLDDTFFAELRIFHAEAGENSLGPAQLLQQRMHQLHKRVNRLVFDLDVTPYSKNVLFEFPDRVQALATYSRIGVADKQIVMRSLLPASGVTYLTLGTHLCLLENPRGGGGVAAPVAQVAAAGRPMTVAEKLQKKTSLSFPRNTLEVSMQLLSEDLGFPITIRGGDLQLEGITKNQSFGLDLRDKPAAEILQTIMKQANPDGKLVYIIKPKEDGSGEEMFITTRAAVAKNGEKLPPELELKDDKKK